MSKQTTMLIVLDGFGENQETDGNAIYNAKKPNIDNLMTICPTASIRASGEAVGLPEGQMGNSEVGYMNIGAGRIVSQNLTKITKSIEEGDFFSIKEFADAIEKCKKNNKKLHIMGLLSDGGVHSHERHLYALLELAKRKGMDDVYVHCFMDGRDTLPASGEGYLQKLEEKMKEKDIGKIATVCGRFYSMDRNKRWDRTEKSYNALVYGKGKKQPSAIQAIERSYQQEVFDEFVVPTVICNGNKPIAKIEDGDTVIFYNFRPDRAIQITRALVDPEFNEFKTEKMNLNFISMTEYDNTIPNVKAAFKPEKIKNTFGEYISHKKLKQLRITETEGNSHIITFFNCGREKKFTGEDRIIVHSPSVENYDMKPEMSAYEITDKAIEAIGQQKYDCILMNYANCDLVGHTGNMMAEEKAIEVVDECIGRITNALKKQGGICLITSANGNAEQMIDHKTGEPFTSHTTNTVPLILFGMENVKLEDGTLCDIAPTLLNIMNVDKPKEMTGQSLLIKS